MKIRQFLTSVLLLSTLVPCAAQAADPPATTESVEKGNKGIARELATEGYAALDRHDYARAVELFTKAEGLFHAPTIVLGLARANLGLGKLMTAQEQFTQVAHETVPPNSSEAFVRAVEDAKRESIALAPRVPGVVIQVTGADRVVVTVDGVEIPSATLGVRRPIDPGSHVIKAMADGFADGEASVTIAEGATQTVTLQMRPGVGTPLHGSGSKGSSLKTAGYIGLGLGGAGIIAGGVMGIVALTKEGDLTSKCPNDICPPSQKSALGGTVDTYNTMRTGAMVGLIGGAALAAAGTVLLVTGPSEPKVGRLVPLVGPGFIGVQGVF